MHIVVEQQGICEIEILLFIQWMKERKTGVVDPDTKKVRPLSKAEDEEYRTKIASVGGLPTPADKPSLWQSIWSSAGAAEESSPSMGEIVTDQMQMY